jgi:hypothetical protein
MLISNGPISSAPISALSSGVAEAIGSASGTSIASGVPIVIGTASGTSTVSGVGQSTSAAPGSSAGTSTVSGVGASTAASVGSAAGTSAVLGASEAITTAIGNAAGTATVAGVGAPIFVAVGNAAGTSEVTGIPGGQRLIAAGGWDVDPKAKARKIKADRKRLEKAFRQAIGEPDPDAPKPVRVSAPIAIAPKPIINLFDFAGMRDAIERQRIEAEHDEDEIILLLAA